MPAASADDAAVGKVGMAAQVAFGLNHIAVADLQAVALTTNLVESMISKSKSNLLESILMIMNGTHD
jgi:hypothetical protein